MHNKLGFTCSGFVCTFLYDCDKTLKIQKANQNARAHCQVETKVILRNIYHQDFKTHIRFWAIINHAS